ncbi:unnamed protein product [Allacma fusca]|uniref:Cadherin domain-containing protein n=1 Tax=Allacma fusca TaxID=39272 RepID=A0A8J2PHQ3_9HEXA|nr:unnamed protein product [Allacma fusca]
MLCLRRVILYGLLISVSHCLLIHAQGPGPGHFLDPFPLDQQPGDSAYSRAVDTRVQFVVKEGLPPGTFVGRIPTKPGFTYRFNENLNVFKLNGTTGEIRTAKEIDREALPSDQFDLVVLSSQPTYPIDLRITVEDVNDNSPNFPSEQVEVKFSEGANPGTLVFLDPAEDLDTGINDVTTEYKILDGNDDNHFRLVVTTNPSGEPPFLHLETTGKLDRETKAFYTLNISAQDGGNPPRFGYLKVNVVIDDSNDNSPNFDHSDYVVSLNESVPPGTVVLQVTATDNDEGDNARITYYLAESEAQFTVDPDTGVVSTTQILNCQQNCPQNQQSCPKSCVFTVFARDHGIPRQDGRTYITVNLLDSNDHDPTLIIRYFPPTASSASVDENAQNDSVVAAISVVDMDEGPNGETVVKIVSGNELEHFRLESTPSFQLVRVNGILDREKISKYNLTIVATDKGTPPRSSTTFLIIRINDVNDHNPNFLKTEYSAVLRELVPIGTYVASITATDEDTGINSQVYYSIVSGNEKMWFHIDPNSGLLTTRAPLDREQQGTIRLKISARDGGPNPKWAHAQIKITILDDNDEKPQLVDENLTVSLSEEAPPGSLVATLTASDHDQGTNGTVSYYLSPESENAYPGFFQVDASNGRLVSRLKFDREALSTYNVQVIAKDQGVPALSSTATVHLIISDVNDNDPRIYPVEYFVPIREDTPVNTNIVSIRAQDPDEGTNAQIHFAIDSGSDGFFSIDDSTGIITINKDLKSSKKRKFKLLVSAKDGGGRKSEEGIVLIEFLSDLEILKCKQDVYNFSIVEDAGNRMRDGKDVGKVECIPSRKEKGMLRYTINSGDEERIFSIDETTGAIRSTKIVDREVKGTYNLTILARNQNSYGSFYAIIQIEDVNDHVPKLESSRVVTEIQENSPIGSDVYLVKATDPDVGENARINYSLTVNPENVFVIDSSNGLISLNKPLRFSPDLTQITIEVTARDNGIPSLSSRMSILLKIMDYNNHSPIFDHSSYETSLLETTSVNSRFFALQATDQDTGKNAQISYEIVDGNGAQKFGVFPDGYLYVKTPLDREEQDYFSLTVMARDNGIPQRSSTVSVVIFLIDENDNPPIFTNSTFTFYIAENEPPDTYVGKITATDSDVGRNAELTYSIHSIQSDFIIDAKNGFVKSLKSFDRENLLQTTGQDFIALEIIVQDSGSVRLSDKAQMIIYVTDVNDNPPIFLRSSYSAQISEGAPLGSQVVRVIASDIDEGLNGDIFYYLKEGNDGDVFKIDTTTGQIILAKHLDRESQPQYTLTVIAQDTAENNPLSSSTSVKIDVLDENDNCPEFSTQSDSRISIIETTPVNTELIKFHASDPDMGLNQQVSLSITGGNRHETFRIDPKSGSLYLNKPLDFERYSSYTLNITASDAGNPRLSTSTPFQVLVQDYNDNAPMFPSTAIVRQIQEGISINTPIVTVSAEDPDSGLNGKVKYSIVAQDPEGNHFGIDPNQGVIHTLKAIDREFADTFRLTVVATDQAIPTSIRLSAEKLVTVIVEDVNDNSPNFVSMNAALLTKGTEKNVEIARVRAKDLDSESNGVVTYEMISGDSSLFKLNRNTGSLSLKRGVGDVQPRYQLTIRATDEAIQSQRKSSDLYLSILGVSDKSNSGLLTFSQATYKGSVLENEPIGSSILTVVASHSDKSFGGNNPQIEYYITNITSKNGDMQDKLFDIDLRRGILSTAAILDREMGVWKFQLEIYAIVVSTRGLHTTSAKVCVL